MSVQISDVRKTLSSEHLLLDVDSYVVDGSRSVTRLERSDRGLNISLRLDLHQLNVLINELEEHRDALVEHLEDEHRRRNARLAEPDDAAPGHENLETYEAVISGANCCRVETSDFSDPIEDMLFLEGTKEGGECALIYHGPTIQGTPKNRPDLHIGDRIEFQRLGKNYIRIVSVISPAKRGPAIDWAELFSAQMQGESEDEWAQERARERESERVGRFA